VELGVQHQRFASERDFVARFLLPKLKEASELMGVSGVIDFYVEKPVNGTPDLTVEKGGGGPPRAKNGANASYKQFAITFLTKMFLTNLSDCWRVSTNLL
jgi:hypothetical protein